MTSATQDDSAAALRKTARVAALLYLVMGVVAPLSLMYFPRTFVVRGDAAATALNVATHPLRYRLWILTGLLDAIVFLFLAWALYKLFKNVDTPLSVLLLVLVSVVATFQLVNLLNLIAPLILLSDTGSLSAFSKPQLDALTLGVLRLRGSAMNIATAFWGLWLLPFGALVIKSRFFPRLIGALLIVGGVAYVVVSFTALAFPAYRQVVDRIAMPFYAIGELSIMLWLLVKGATVTSAKVA